MGGVAQMLLTHKDDIAAHESFRVRFGTARTMHRADGAARLQIEQVIDGEESIPLDEDLLAIPTPGHTRGHVVFLYKQKFLFTGDHLAWSPARETLTAFRSVAWYSWPEQIRSMEKLLAYDFEWVLPGHGDMHHDSAPIMKSHLERCIAWMKTQELKARRSNFQEETMNKNQKIALGCGGAGCFGLIFLVIVGVVSTLYGSDRLRSS
jgi:glyoxylase-like metal-dependent hydrolase (beta-lactamase superfamily II)